MSSRLNVCAQMSRTQMSVPKCRRPAKNSWPMALSDFDVILLFQLIFTIAHGFR